MSRGGDLHRGAVNPASEKTLTVRHTTTHVDLVVRLADRPGRPMVLAARMTVAEAASLAGRLTVGQSLVAPAGPVAARPRSGAALVG